MGLDGGTIATRTDLLRRSSWRLANHDGGGQRSTRGGQLTAAGALNTVGVERRGAAADARDGFTVCSLSGARFEARVEPGEIVACALGRLHLRSAVVEFLMRHGQFAHGMCDFDALEEACGSVDLGTCTLRDCAGSTVADVDLRGNVNGHSGLFLGQFEGYKLKRGDLQVVALYLMLIDPGMCTEDDR